ncbi:MAG TPA: folylpolyglutamate synthase/dihydrofolate synthase family protein [Bryobacteraceae bacterium]|nr:folylpolyglutamate synthase/dihydrofolate synthase family protein [Bryobacteraceae bacterium]
MAYPDSVDFLYSLGNEVKSIKFGLEGIQALLRELGNPHLGYPTIHVAGTNGKGSTCAMIESSLRTAGTRTGLYTSPHLIDPTERIQIDGVPVSRAEFAGVFDRVHEAAERLVANGTLEHHTTYFETVTAMGFMLFREAKVEVAVIETGLGGRLDATNVVNPELCVITPIDFDHEAFLGSSLESIAAEKAGILKPAVPLVLAPQRPEAEAVVAARAHDLRVPIQRVADKGLSGVLFEPYGSQFEVDGLQIRCPLPGEHQVQNAATAVTALKHLGVPNEAIERGVAGTTWPGRLERVATGPDIVLDGAHNPAGARALARYIESFHAGRRPVWLVYGTMRDKSVEEITELLFPLADRIILTAPAQPRAVRPELLREAAERNGACSTATGVVQAIEFARQAPSDAVVFVTGSLYLVGEARAILVK